MANTSWWAEAIAITLSEQLSDRILAALDEGEESAPEQPTSSDDEIDESDGQRERERKTSQLASLGQLPPRLRTRSMTPQYLDYLARQ